LPYAAPNILEVLLTEGSDEAVLCVPPCPSSYLLNMVLVYSPPPLEARVLLNCREDHTLDIQIETHPHGISGNEEFYVTYSIVEHIGLGLLGLRRQCPIDYRTVIRFYILARSRFLVKTLVYGILDLKYSFPGKGDYTVSWLEI
jgi:hypothetical protein